MKFPLMKNLVLLFAFAAIIISCKKSDVQCFTINPNAKIYVKPTTSNTKSLPFELTPLEVVKKANFFSGL